MYKKLHKNKKMPETTAPPQPIDSTTFRGPAHMDDAQNHLMNTEVNTQDPRQELIEEVLMPYHIHYAEGIEGASINPEASERNFDTLLVLTKLIREQRVTRRLENGNTTEWEQDPAIDWYFEKYAAHGLTHSDLNKPAKVVRLWLEKLGPHNDMADATDDLLQARKWLIKDNDTRNRSSKLEPIETKEFGLIAEIDTEIGELVDPEDRYEFFAEAASYFQHHIEQQDGQKHFGPAVVSRMKLSAIRIEMQREKILGTNQPTQNYSEEQLAKFEGVVEQELDVLREQFKDYLHLMDGMFANLGPAAAKDNAYKKLRGSLFEVYAYLRIMDGVVSNGTLASEKFRPGTLREESGTAHKIDEHPNSRRLKNADGSEIELDEHGFNYNFDFLHTVLIKKPNQSGALYNTLYVQTKIDTDYAPEAKAKDASAKFWAGKEFLFVVPTDFLSESEQGETADERIHNIIVNMHKWVETQEED